MNRQMCRLCFEERARTIGIFGAQRIELNIVEVIRIHLSDEVSENDLLPKWICRDCWAKLKSFHEFYKSVSKARNDFLMTFVKYEEPNFVEINCDSVECANDAPSVKLEPFNDDVVSEIRRLENFVDENNLFHDVYVAGDEYDSNAKVLDDSAKTEVVKRIVKKREINYIRGEDIDESAQFDHLLPNYIDIPCGICKHPFKTLREVIRHYRTIHKQRSIRVKCCQRRVKISGELRDHIQYHLNPNEFNCGQCDRNFISRYALNKHLKQHTQNTIDHFADEEFSNNANDAGDEYDSKAEMLVDDSAAPDVAQSVIEEKEINSITDEDINESEQFDHLLPNYIDIPCGICKHPFKTLREVIRHYRIIHKQRSIRVKCCHRRVKISGELRDHIQFHLNPNEFNCGQCDRRFISRYALNQHLKQHEQPQEVECDICKKQMSYSGLRNHFRAHFDEQQECSICQKRFATKVHLRSHVKGTHERRYHRACPICSKEFNAKRRLLDHLKVHQKIDAEMELKNQIANAEAEIDRLIPNYMDMQCELCQYTFETLSEARSHYRSKHKRHTHLVKCCQLRLKIHGEIRDHIKFHLNPNEFKCGECGKTYHSGYQLNSHARRHLAGHSKDRFECDICNKQMSSKNCIRSHILRVHLNEEGKHKCKICEKRFVTMSEYRQHVQKVHERLHQQICHICAKVCRTNDHMKMHLKEHSEIKEPPVTCEHCGKSYKNKNLLKKHISTQHEHDGKVHECAHCHRQFTKRHLMRDHVLYHHKVKFHKCDICDKKFRKPRLLREHMTVHTGVDLYQCEYCPSTFKASATKHSHYKRIHPDEWRAAREARQMNK